MRVSSTANHREGRKTYGRRQKYRECLLLSELVLENNFWIYSVLPPPPPTSLVGLYLLRANFLHRNVLYNNIKFVTGDVKNTGGGRIDPIFLSIYVFFYFTPASKSYCLLFRPLLRGEELFTQMVFFVQTILGDRYIHRRVL